MINHLAMFKNANEFPLIPLFDTEYRTSPVSPRHLSICPVIFELFDYVNHQDDIKLTQVPVKTILSMPLRKLLIYTNPSESDHWTMKHTKYTADLFMVFDVAQQRLRLKVNGEYSRFPRLCQNLYHEILTHRTIKLKPFVWQHILESPAATTNSISEWQNHPAIASIKTNLRWRQFSSQGLRHHYLIDDESPIIFHAKAIKAFWRTAMYPQARTIFYRALSKCIPSKDILLKLKLVSSSICSFCGSSDDSFKHFLVLCPPKQIIWSQVLSHYYPHLFFSTEDLYLTLTSLEKPYWVRHCSRYIPIISTILWQQWNLYWSHGADNNNPIFTTNLHKFISRIVSLIERLLNPKLKD
jgi:hypothetical protein